MILGWWSKFKVNFGTVYKTLGHDTDYSVCPNTFKLNMQVVDDERRNPYDFGSLDPRSTLTLCL